MIAIIGFLVLLAGGYITTQERHGAMLGPFLMAMGAVLIIAYLFK